MSGLRRMLKMEALAERDRPGQPPTWHQSFSHPTITGPLEVFSPHHSVLPRLAGLTLPGGVSGGLSAS